MFHNLLHTWPGGAGSHACPCVTPALLLLLLRLRSIKHGSRTSPHCCRFVTGWLEQTECCFRIGEGFFRDFLVKFNLFLSLINGCGESSVFSVIGVFSLWLNLELMPFSWRLFFFNIPLVHLLNVQSFCKFTGVLFHCSKNLIWPLMVLFHFAESGVHTSSDWLVTHHFVN